MKYGERSMTKECSKITAEREQIMKVAIWILGYTLAICLTTSRVCAQNLQGSGGLLVPANEVSESDIVRGGTRFETTTVNVRLTLEKVLEGNKVAGLVGWPINSAKGTGALTLSSSIPSPNFAKGAVWEGVDKDVVKNDEFHVQGEKRVYTSIADGTNRVITRSIAISPDSDLKHLQIGKNESVLLENYLKHGIERSYTFPPAIKEKVLQSDLTQIKKMATAEVNKWEVAADLRSRLKKDIANAKTPAEMDTLLSRIVMYRLRSWVEYSANERITNPPKATFGHKIGQKHFIEWTIGIADEKGKIKTVLDSAKSPLIGECFDGKWRMQRWGGVFPMKTKINVDKLGMIGVEILEAEQENSPDKK